MILRSIGLAFHRFIAISALISRIYLWSVSKILKLLPDTRLKLRFLNNLSSVEWPDIDLSPQKILLAGVPLKIIPHFKEFDFYSLGMRELKYEQSVFTYLKNADKKYDAIIEIGSNVGVYTIFFATFYKNCDIYAFEPSHEAYLRLLKNLEVNRLSAHTVNAAVGDKNSFESFYEPSGHLTNGSLLKDFSSIFSSDIKEGKVLVINGDLLESVLSKCGNVLIKIDVEGGETMVLRGLSKIIEEKRPDILIECLQLYESALNDFKLHEKYSLFELTEKGPVQRERFVAGENRDYFLTTKRGPGGLSYRK